MTRERGAVGCLQCLFREPPANHHSEAFPDGRSHRFTKSPMLWWCRGLREAYYFVKSVPPRVGYETFSVKWQVCCFSPTMHDHFQLCRCSSILETRPVLHHALSSGEEKEAGLVHISTVFGSGSPDTALLRSAPVFPCCTTWTVRSPITSVKSGRWGRSLFILSQGTLSCAVIQVFYAQRADITFIVTRTQSFATICASKSHFLGLWPLLIWYMMASCGLTGL